MNDDQPMADDVDLNPLRRAEQVIGQVQRRLERGRLVGRARRDRRLASGTVGAAAYRRARPYLDRNRSASRGVFRCTRVVQPSASAWRPRRTFSVSVGGTRASHAILSSLPASTPASQPPSLPASQPSSLPAFRPQASSNLRRSSSGMRYVCSVAGNGARTSATYARSASRIASPIRAYCLTNRWTWPVEIPRRSCQTSTCPSHEAPADPNRRDVESFGNARRDRCGNGLEDHGKAAGRLERAGLVHEAMGRFSRAALDPVAAQFGHRLRRQADVAHHRHAGIDDRARARQGRSCAFDLTASAPPSAPDE